MAIALTPRPLLLGLSLITCLFTSCAASRQVRYVPARWLQDDDRRPISQPKARTEYSIADGANYQFFYQIERLVDIPLRGERALHAMGLSTLEEAHNTNNFDEVADSSWFTNRLGKRALSAEELRYGPGIGQGPDPAGPWTIDQAKSTGVTPGFRIRDAKGGEYFLKFDPVEYPELATGAELISTRLLHAFGYNVPDCNLVTFSPDILRISEKLAKASGKHSFTPEMLAEMLKHVPRTPDGKVRALASKLIEGKILGPFTPRGKRGDDPNDRIPHEHRRELRGYRVFSAFIGNADVREGNTLDSFIAAGPEDKGYVRHYQLDFGSTLGSSARKPKSPNHLNDYDFNYGKVFGSTVTFGGYRPKWEKAKDPDIPSVGLFESERFKPQSWNPHYPYPPFQYATDRDDFWATKILIRLSDDDIAAVVKEAQYSDPRAAPYITQILIERRDKIRDYWFSKLNPLDDFALRESPGGLELSFADLAIASGMRRPGSATYLYRIDQGILPLSESRSERLEIPRSAIEAMAPGKFYNLQIQTRVAGEKDESPIIDLVLKKSDGLRLMGLKRRYKS